jgi:hypothetical protein
VLTVEISVLLTCLQGRGAVLLAAPKIDPPAGREACGPTGSSDGEHAGHDVTAATNTAPCSAAIHQTCAVPLVTFDFAFRLSGWYKDHRSSSGSDRKRLRYAAVRNSSLQLHVWISGVGLLTPRKLRRIADLICWEVWIVQFVSRSNNETAFCEMKGPFNPTRMCHATLSFKSQSMKDVPRRRLIPHVGKAHHPLRAVNSELLSVINLK